MWVSSVGESQFTSHMDYTVALSGLPPYTPLHPCYCDVSVRCSESTPPLGLGTLPEVAAMLGDAVGENSHVVLVAPDSCISTSIRAVLMKLFANYKLFEIDAFISNMATIGYQIR